MPFFSVIVPNYNHGAFLQERLESILAQIFTDYEIILLDDASTDESDIIIKQYKDHPKLSHFEKNTQNSGSVFHQWKKGISMAKGEWIWIAESDDTASPQFLHEAFKAINNQRDIGLFYCDGLIDKDGAVKEKFSERKNQIFQSLKWSADHVEQGKQAINQHLKYHCTVNNISGVVFKKSILKPDDIPTDFNYHGDWFFYIRLLTLSAVFYSAKPLNIYREHSGSVTAQILNVQQRRIEYFKVLQELNHQEFVSNKTALHQHFLKHYLGAGFIEDTIRGRTPWLQFFKIDKRLSFQLLISLFKLRWHLMKKGNSV